MPREAQAERDSGMSAIGGDGDGCRTCHLTAAAAADDNAGDRRSGAALADRHATNGDAGFEVTTGGERVRDQQRIEIAAQDRAPAEAVRISTLDLGAALAR